MKGRLEHDIRRRDHIQRMLAEMPAFVEDFYMTMAISMEQSTCETYLKIIKHFLSNIGNSREVTIDMFNERNVSRYMISQQTKRKDNGEIEATSFSHQKTTWTALNKFFNYLVNRDELKRNPMANIDRPKNKDDVKRKHFNEDDMKAILNSQKAGAGNKIAKARQVKWKERDLAILTLFMTTGMRKTALTEINLDDINFNEHTLTIIDKRHKTHVYDLSSEVEVVLKRWIKCRENIMKDRNNDALFVSCKRNRISENAISDLIKKYSEDGLGYKISPHKLRAAFIMILFDGTHDIEFVKETVGHESIMTTSRYIKTGVPARKESMRMLTQKYLV